MLYHIEARHQAHNCPVTLSTSDHGRRFYENTVGRLLAGDHAAESKVTLLSALVSGPSHTFYLTVEANDNGNLTRFLAPLKTFGECAITPVTDLKEHAVLQVA